MADADPGYDDPGYQDVTCSCCDRHDLRVCSACVASGADILDRDAAVAG